MTLTGILKFCKVLKSPGRPNFLPAICPAFTAKNCPAPSKRKDSAAPGSFLVICVNDTQPRIHNGKNLNIIAAKARYRQIIGSNCIHAGDLQPEAEENLLFLTGLNWQDLLSSRQQPTRRPIKLYQDLCGTPSWLDEEQFEQFLRKLPNIRFSRNADEFKILTDDRHQTCRLLNASKKNILMASRLLHYSHSR